MKLEINNTRKMENLQKNAEIKQHAKEQLVDQIRDQKSNTKLRPMKAEIYQNLWDMAKVVLREMIIAISDYIKKGSI